MNMIYMFYLCCFCILKLAAHDAKSSAVSARGIHSPSMFVNGNHHMASAHRKGKNLYGVLGFLSGYRLGQGIGFHSNSHLNMFGKMLNGDLHITYGRYGDPFGHIIAAAHNEYHHVPYYPQYQQYPPIYSPPPPAYQQPHPPPTQPWYPVPHPGLLHMLPQYPPVMPMPQHAAGDHNRPPSSHPASSPLNQQQIVNIHEPLNANDPPQDNYQEVRDINRQQIVNRLPDTSRPPGATLRDGPESYDSSGPVYEDSDGDQSSSEKLDDRLDPPGPQDQRGLQRTGPFRELYNRISTGPSKLFKTQGSPPDMHVMKDMLRMTTTNAPVMSRKPNGKPKNNGRMKVSVEIDQPGRPSVIIQNQNLHPKPKPMPPPPNSGARPPGGGAPPNRQMPPNVEGENNENPNGGADEEDYDEEDGGDNGSDSNGDDSDIGNGNGNQNVDGNNGDENTNNSGSIVNETTTPMTIATTPTTMSPTTGDNGIPPTTVRPVYGPPSPDNGVVSITRPSVEVPEYPFKPSYHYVYNNYLPDQHHQQPVKMPEEYVHEKAPWEYVGQAPDTEEYGVQQAPFRTYPEYPGPYQRDPFGRARDHKAI